MKKPLLALYIVFTLVSCDTGNMETSESNPFIGTWEDRDDYVVEQFILTKDLEVTRTVQALSPENEQANETNIGTYDYDDLKIFFRYQMPDNVIAVVSTEYFFNGDELTMTFRNQTYTYKKIK